MLREALLCAALVAGLAALAPTTPALPAACDAALFAEESLQDDANTGADAADAPEDAALIVHDGYYSGYLSPVGHANADREDWYRYAVPTGIELMSVNMTWEFPLVPVYTVEAPMYLQTFTMTVFPPAGGAPLATTPGAPTLTIASPTPGEYLVRISTDATFELEGCAAGSPVPPAPAGTSHARNHGMYLGCNPVCSATSFDATA